MACVAGAVEGGAFAGSVPQRALARGFAVVVVIVAASLIGSVALLGGPPGG